MLSTRKFALAAIALAALVGACRQPGGEAAIGLGFRSAGLDAARLANASLDTLPPPRLRILTEVSPEIRPPAGMLAAEVDYATRIAAIEDVVGVVGHQGSREALLVAPIYGEAGIAQVVPTATSRRLRDAGPHTFLLAPNDSMEGAFMASFAAGLGARSATIFYVLDEYGTGLRDGLTAELAARGVRVLEATPVQPSAVCSGSDNPYASTVDAALLRGRPDIILLALRQREGGCIIGHAGRRHPGMRFLAGDGITVNRDLLEPGGAFVDSLYLVVFWHPDRPDPLSRDFAARFRATVGREPTGGDAMIYDALMVLAAAAREGQDRDGVRRYLSSLGRARPAFRGVTGDVAFPGGPERLLMARVRGDRVVLVETP